MFIELDLIRLRELSTKELAEELNSHEMPDLRTIAQLVNAKLPNKGQLSRLDVINALLEKIEHQRPAQAAQTKQAAQQDSLFDLESIPAKPRRNY